MLDSSADLSPDHGVIALWSAPRSRSTAFSRMMMARPDVLSLHEPFSRRSGFGEVEIDGGIVRTEAALTDAIRRLGGRTRVFFKDTMDYRYAGVLADADFLRAATHTFIIRRPDEVIASHFAMNPRLRCDEVGFGYLHELYVAVVEAGSSAPVVIDADDLVTQPEATVRAYCDRVGLAFDLAAMSWSPGMPTEWKQTERWHVGASETTGFVASPTRYADTVHNNAMLAEYHAFHQPFFEYLHARRLTPGAT